MNTEIGAPMNEAYDYEIVNISDFRLPGGTSKSLAQELKVQRETGIRTGLICSFSRLVQKRSSWDESIRGQIDGRIVQIAPLSGAVRCRVVVIRHPVTAEGIEHINLTVFADAVVVVANHAVFDADGTQNYDVAAIDQALRKKFNRVPVWAPIGPNVRSSLDDLGSDDINVSPIDWVNILPFDDAPTPRTGFVGDTRTIGRHSRPQAAKWPADEKTIRRLYPTTREFQVRILGGVQPARKLLGGVPSAWEVLPFGAMDPMEYLAGVDFWVYFHHPNTREAFGRAVMEALWSGAVVVLPEYMRETFGEAALYADPKDVLPLLRDLSSDVDRYLAQSARGQEFLEQFRPARHTERLARFGVKAGATRGATRIIDDRDGSRNGQTLGLQLGNKPRVMFVTSNGAGMGHLTRLLGIARTLRKQIQPIFFSMSQGVGVVASEGFPFEYVPFTPALGVTPGEWNDYFAHRLQTAISDFGVQGLVFDGTWPYKGLVKALSDSSLRTVWVRRAMWKSNIKPSQLSKAQYFDLVIEPGEYAAAYDSGATTRVSDAVKVGPITVLSNDELLSREQAREELGYGADERLALITLGAGNINDISSAQDVATRFIREYEPGWRVVLTKPPIANSREAGAASQLSVFPLARYSRAFDVAVAANGYNSFHELVNSATPTVWIPNRSTMTDDQEARARFADDAGWGAAVLTEDVSDLLKALQRVLPSESRQRMRRLMADAHIANGAVRAGELIVECVTGRRVSFQ